MSAGDLDAQAQEFATTLTDLIRGTVGGTTTFEVVADGQFRKIGPAPFTSGRDLRRRPRSVPVVEQGFGTVRLTRSCDRSGAGDHDRLRLRVEFNCRLDDEGVYLTVETSTFGLWVITAPGRKAKPFVRLEYLRTPVVAGQPSAHVHLHAESAELAWIYGTAGLPMPRLEEIHFPVGGRRFRPTVEDFLLVLDRERIFMDWEAADWRATIERSLADWEVRQTKAAVRRWPEAAREALAEYDRDHGDSSEG